jgi:hypothetical protein
MFPSDLLAMFSIWYVKTGQRDNSPSWDETTFGCALEKVLPEFGVNCERLESKNSYNFGRGPFRFGFRRFRLSLLGMEVLEELYRQANKS